MDISKEAEYDTLPPKIIKLAAPSIVTLLTKIINLSIPVSKYPDTMKEACIIPVFKKGDHLRKENYKPISILNTFPEVFERYILEQLTPFFNVTMSQFLSAYISSFEKTVYVPLTSFRVKVTNDKRYIFVIFTNQRINEYE